MKIVDVGKINFRQIPKRQLLCYKQRSFFQNLWQNTEEVSLYYYTSQEILKENLQLLKTAWRMKEG